MSSTTTNPSPTWPIRQYTPRHPSWPYTPHDFTRPDPSADSTFYASPRFVTHIDDAAIASLREYYSQVLPPVPQTGPPPRILDLCSSWTSHFPPRIVDAVGRGEVEVWGLGMNARELERNPVFRDGGKWGVWDLNREGEGDVGVAVKETILKTARGSGEVEMGSPSPSKAQEEHEPCLDATTCVVSTDYLTNPSTSSPRSYASPNPAEQCISRSRTAVSPPKPSPAGCRWMRRNACRWLGIICFSPGGSGLRLWS
ncbi:hypothetical protein BTJ68_05334 [Hortaea werneckii EXF-2000]|uniref:Uncharacterized protein n=1 Tax=Hortaea werneckii EXF-2000 TaxID=1157616 RepID=A0A1Z5TF93_HORWE|nr:hypothetical protein BTJ68_05334 [Hortaea werneckii EXF-2000]